MIILDPPCKECGEIPQPTKIACDTCGKQQDIYEFVGIVMHFDESSEPCDENCEDCQECEFHFCGLKCLSDYLSDPHPECDKIRENEDKPLTLHCNTSDVGTIIYALGRGELFW